MITLMVKLRLKILPFKFKDDTMDIEIHADLLPDLISMAELAARNNVSVGGDVSHLHPHWFLTVNPDYTGTVRHWGGTTLRFRLIQTVTTHHLEVIPS